MKSPCLPLLLAFLAFGAPLTRAADSAKTTAPIRALLITARSGGEEGNKIEYSTSR